MKIRPVILCGGAGTRLWPGQKRHQPKQFIDFGGWTLFGRSLERVKDQLFDIPIISTNLKYLKEIKKNLAKHNIKKYKIILEPGKKNTGPAILSSALIKDIPNNVKETSLQETEMSSREFNSFFLSTILRFSPLQPSKPENKPCSTPI